MNHIRFVGFLATNVGLSAQAFAQDEFEPRNVFSNKPDLRPKLQQKEESENHYKTLGVGWDASKEVIRKNYKQLALFYHPDKQAHRSAEASAQFSKISAAYAILSDPLRRLVYDLVLGIRDKTDSEVRIFLNTLKKRAFCESVRIYDIVFMMYKIIRMSKMKMEQALEDVENMSCTVPLKRETEEKKKGLVIINATYGLVQDATEPLTILNSDVHDETSIDVTIPMQCMVEDSTLIIPPGESKSWLTGFYDPCIGEPKQLRVRYLFWGRLHEVVINDEDELKIPIKGHLLGDEVQFRAQVSLTKNTYIRKNEIQKGKKYQHSVSPFHFYVECCTIYSYHQVTDERVFAGDDQVM